jgi:DNA-directed RNA polymerase subunit RPC12/RpoP
MENKELHITLKCLFCGCDFKGDTEKKYQSGDMLKCQECSELNDYDSLMARAIDEGKAAAAEYAKEEIEKMLKGIFK